MKKKKNQINLQLIKNWFGETMTNQKASFLPISHNQSKATPANIPPNRKITSKFPNAFCSGPFTKSMYVLLTF